MVIDHRHLVHALAVAEHRSFRAAAEAVGISQPALSRSIQALEGRLRVRIFDRERRGIRPTPLGRIVLDRARALLEGARELEREIALQQGLELGELVVGAGPAVAEARLGPALGRLLRERPGLGIRARVDHWRALERSLGAGEIELFVGEASEAERDPAFRVERLAPDPCVFFCRAGHPLARRRRVTLDDVRAYPMVAPRIPPRILAWLHPGQEDPPQAVECESYAVVRAALLASDAVSGGLLSSIAEDVRARRLAVLPVRAPEFVLHAGVVSLRARTLSPAAEVFAKIVIAVDRDLSRGEAKLRRV